jgi:tetratricopeptide (TPR) repeat protein
LDKYEYKLKLDQMKSAFAEGNYHMAEELADSINWKRVRNANSLIKAGEVYETAERYDDAKEMFLLAYERSPIGRTIVYRLAELAIHVGNYDEAMEYYEEFVEMAPNDSLKFVLKYKIYKAKGESLAEQIQILEDLKEQEYIEEWAYELAYLYHQAGMSEKCVEACDELILWFGDGAYVEKALELKMLYQPLTKQQEEKYRQFRQKRDGVVEVRPNDMLNSGEIVSEVVKIPQVTMNASRFNTVNLQNELAKNMQQIMDATEKEEVNDSMDAIKKMVEEIPYLQLPHESEEQKEEKYGHIETDEEIDGSLKINFKEMLAEDSDGQISLYVPKDPMVERQITGQMSIQEVLEEWEKTKRAAEAALQEAEQRRLESAKARALQEAEEIMERLVDVIPQLNAGLSPKELLEQEYMQNMPEKDEKAARLFQNVNDILTREIEKLSKENNSIDQMIEENKPAEESFGQEMENEMSEELSEEIPQELPQVSTDIGDLLVEEPIPEEIEAAKELMPEEPAKQEELPSIQIPEDVIEDEDVTMHLTKAQKEIFSYFVPIQGMEQQLCQVLTGVKRRLGRSTNSTEGNIMIQGGPGSGKTVLATDLIKVIQEETGLIGGKIGKIEAASLNQKDIPELMKKVRGGCLIIEKAGEITRETAVKMSLQMSQDTAGMLVILEDTKEGIRKALGRDEEFARKFTEKVNIPIFSIDELVEFAKSYAQELEYEIDEMGVLALYNRISSIEKLDEATTLFEVKDIVDEAVAKSEKGGFKKAFSVFASKRHGQGDRKVLQEKDFEE